MGERKAPPEVAKDLVAGGRVKKVKNSLSQKKAFYKFFRLIPHKIRPLNDNLKTEGERFRETHITDGECG